MTAFWIFAAGLLALAGWMVLPALLKPDLADDVDRTEINRALQRKDFTELENAHATGELDEQTYQQAREELERQILETEYNRESINNAGRLKLGRMTALVIAISVPMSSLLGYQMLGGGAEAVAQQVSPAMTVPASPHGNGMGMSAELPPIDQLTERLAQRLQANPDDVDGWLLLARSYHHLGRQADAQSAYKQAQARGGQDAELAALIASPASESPSSPQISTDAAIASLVERTTTDPKNGQSWLELAQLYRSSRDFRSATEAFAKAKMLLPANADLLADYADAMAADNDRSLDGEPTALVEQALQLDPNHPKALWLAATAALQRNDTEVAKGYWRHLQQLLPEGSADRRVIDRNLAALSGEPLAESIQVDVDKPAVIQGRVDITPEMRARVNDDDTLFIFARAVDGPPMPLAVLRKKVRDLPFDFSLDDSLAMQPQMTLSKFDQVTLGARVSRSGTVTQQPGEPRGDMGPVPTRGGSKLQLMIDKPGS